MHIRRIMPLALISMLLAACAPAESPRVLLFNGTGTSSNDVIAFKRILDERHMAYATVNSRELKAMTPSQLRSHGLLIVPGGNFEQIATS